MSTQTATKTARTVVASATNTAGSTARGTLDLRTALGAIVTMKITNGGTGPTTQCEGRVLVAHNDGATPTAASAGSDWKTLFVFGGGTSNNGVTEQSIVIPAAVQHVEVEFTGNTGQSVTVEAYAAELTSINIA